MIRWTRDPMAPPLPTLALLLALGAAACGSPAVEGGALPDTTVLERVARIGEVTGDEHYQLGYVAGLAVDDDGRVYVSDRMASHIRVYSGTGEFVRQVGREGAGPGELQHPSDLFFDGAGRLWVRDSRRVTVLAPRGDAGVPDSVVETRPFGGYPNWTSSARSTLIDGVYYYPGQQFQRDGTGAYFYFGYDSAGVTGDTIRVPDYGTLRAAGPAYYRTGARGGRLVRGLSRAPFEPAASWTLTRRGTLLGGSGESELIETDRSGDTLRVIPLVGRRPVTGRERADSAAALDARIDSLPVPLEEVVGASERVLAGDLPDSVPGFLAVHTSTTGEIWVRRWPPAGSDDTHFDVYSPAGELTGHVRVPGRLFPEVPPFIGPDRLVGVERDPVTDVHTVAVYRFPTG